MQLSATRGAQQVKKRRSSRQRVHCARARKSRQFCLKMRHYCHLVLSCHSPPSTLPKCRRLPPSTLSGWGCLPDLSTPQPKFYPLRSMNSRRNLGYPPEPSATNVRKRCGFLLSTPKNWFGSPGFKRWPALSSQRTRQSPNGSMHLRRRSTGSNLSTWSTPIQGPAKLKPSSTASRMAMSCERPCDYTESRSRNIPPRWPRHSMAKAGFTATDDGMSAAS